MPVARLRVAASGAVVLMALISALAVTARAQTFKVLYSFTGGADGGGVWGGVLMDKQGNLYGTTSGGGAYGYGTIFELSPNSDGTWSETVLHSFMLNDRNGSNPQSTLIFDPVGNLYGAALSGGKYSHGTVFELTPNGGGWSIALLYAFGAYRGDAGAPDGSLLMDGNGNLYGAGLGGAIGPGAVFRLSPGSNGWTESLLYSFGAGKGAGGAYPGGLVFDAAGNLYGSASSGGDLNCAGGNGCGVAYKLRFSTNGWRETLLHTFGAFPRDGKYPSGRLAFDSLGNLYGTTAQGGANTCFGTTGCGAAFKLTPGALGLPWKQSLIHQFGSGVDGSTPVGSLIVDQTGTLYGATATGGGACGCGVIYSLTPSLNSQWIYRILHPFVGSDGAEPAAGLIFGSNGDLYGTTVIGGSGGAGVVFEITP
jgi:uncharacterized repeat protein (TIGR03803 family)